MLMIRQHRPSSPSGGTLFHGWTELCRYGCDRHKTNPPTPKFLLHPGTEIGHHNISFDKRIPKEGHTYRTIQFPPVF